MLLPALVILIALIALVWSADHFVNSAASMAKTLGMSPLLIGLTVVSLGTSAPEILVAIMAASDNHTGLAAGNALGSNIANIGLVLAITALIAPLPIKGSLIRKELPLLLAITLLAGWCLHDLHLGLVDAALLLCSLLFTLYLLVRWQRPKALETAHHEHNPLLTEIEADDEVEPDIADMTLKLALGLLVMSLTVLLISSRALVWGATEIALLFGVSDLIIGLTIVAVGTSLPELAASIASALKNHHDIAIGNVVGSNIFNILAVLAMPGLILPSNLDSAIFSRDFVSMLLLTLALLFMAGIALRRNKSKPRIGRFFGAILFAGYCAYYAVLYLSH